MNQPALRVFFALWPTALVRRMMTRSYRQVLPLEGVGRLVQVQNLHMTLHFIGNIEESALDCLIRAGDAVSVEPFSLKLTDCGQFEQAQVSWLGCHVFPAQLQQLHEQLRDALSECGHQPESRLFRPHVSMAHKVPSEVMANFAGQRVEPVRWSVKRFVLLETVQDKESVTYRVRHSWPLRAK